MARPKPTNRFVLDPSLHPTNPPTAEWRCRDCGKLLGKRHGARLHISLQGHDYRVNLPAEAVCRGCGTVNRT